MTHLIIIMGVSGCGKSTVSKSLGIKTGWPVLEGDDYHPPVNVQKMSNNVALTDIDRAEWVTAINNAVGQKNDSPIILACSALTAFVQEALVNVKGRTCMWIWLSGSPALLEKRLKGREGHFMKADLLVSQFEALTPPACAIEVSVDHPVDDVVSEIIKLVS